MAFTQHVWQRYCHGRFGGFDMVEGVNDVYGRLSLLLLLPVAYGGVDTVTSLGNCHLQSYFPPIRTTSENLHHLSYEVRSIDSALNNQVILYIQYSMSTLRRGPSERHAY
jgi:hypothetical protein